MIHKCNSSDVLFLETPDWIFLFFNPSCRHFGQIVQLSVEDFTEWHLTWTFLTDTLVKFFNFRLKTLWSDIWLELEMITVAICTQLFTKTYPPSYNIYNFTHNVIRPKLVSCPSKHMVKLLDSWQSVHAGSIRNFFSTSIILHVFLILWSGGGYSRSPPVIFFAYFFRYIPELFTLVLSFHFLFLLGFPLYSSWRRTEAI